MEDEVLSSKYTFCIILKQIGARHFSRWFEISDYFCFRIGAMFEYMYRVSQNKGSPNVVWFFFLENLVESYQYSIWCFEFSWGNQFTSISFKFSSFACVQGFVPDFFLLITTLFFTCILRSPVSKSHDDDGYDKPPRQTSGRIGKHYP